MSSDELNLLFNYFAYIKFSVKFLVAFYLGADGPEYCFYLGAEIVACVALWWTQGGGQCEERAQNSYDAVCLILLVKIHCTYFAQYYIYQTLLTSRTLR